MTLIMTFASRDRIIQASDRRLTKPNGSIFDDNSNKALCVMCTDAYFSIAYTGEAFIGRKKTDEWLLDYLTDIKAGQMNLVSLIQKIESKLSGLFWVSKKALTFVFTGFLHQLPFIIVISNVDNGINGGPKKLNDKFVSKIYKLKAAVSKIKNPYILHIDGTDEAVDKYITHRIKKLIRKKFFHFQKSQIAATELVSLIRAANRTPNFGKYIGRSCMTLVMTSTPGDDILAEYYPDKASPVQYMPHFIRPEFSIKNVEIWTGEGPPSWWQE